MCLMAKVTDYVRLQYVVIFRWRTLKELNYLPRGSTSKGDVKRTEVKRERRRGEEGKERELPICKFLDPPLDIM